MIIHRSTMGAAWLAVCLAAVLSGGPLSAQAGLGAPDVEDVYGGRVTWMDAVATSGTSTRVFVTTESANSMFYADVDHSASPATVGTFTVVPDLDSSGGYGSGIRQFSVDASSGWVFFTHMNDLSACTVTAGSTVGVDTNGIDAVLAHGGSLFYAKRDGNDLELHFGAVASPFTPHADSPLTLSSVGESASRLIVDPSTDALCVFVAGAPPVIYTSSDTYGALSSGTGFSAMTTADLVASGLEYTAFGIGPDGRVFAGAVEDAEPDQHKSVAYTDAGGDPWTAFDTGVGGTSGANLACAGTPGAYHVYFGSAVSTNEGASGSWTAMPNGGTRDSHVNDGASWADPNDGDLVYVTTDLGLGVTPTAGVDLADICDGIVAVQVNGFDMDAGKTTGWAASKSGVRHVSGYATTAEAWSNHFPMDDGSPYVTVAMDPSDATGASAYAGNVRLYKTTDAGSSWTRPFSTEDQPSLSFWNHVAAIAVSETDPDFVMIGIGTSQVEPGAVGELYYSLDATSASSTWTQLATGGANTIVRDLLMVEDPASGDATLYVACEYLSDGVSSSYAVKTIEYTASSQSFTYDNVMTSAATGTSVTNYSAHGLAVDSAGNVFVAGNTATSGEPRVFELAAGATEWSPLANATLPAAGEVAALCIGEDPAANEVPYIAIGETIFYLDGTTGTTWVEAYTYPTGTDVNVLYWDELLVGTGAGLYAQKLESHAGEVAFGSVLSLAASNVGKNKSGLQYADDTFAKTPKVKAHYEHLGPGGKPRKGVVRTLEKLDAPAAAVSCEFLARATLLDKSLIDKTQTAAEYLPVAQLGSLSCALRTVTKDSDGNKGLFTAGAVTMKAPVISEVTDTEGGTITSAGAGQQVALVGSWFGTGRVSVWLEYERKGVIRTRRCKLIKAAHVYEDARGKPAAMDAGSATGDSRVVVQLPSGFPAAWDSESDQHNLVLANKAGRATIAFTTTP